MKILRALLLISICLPLAACGSLKYYDGATRSDSEVAEVYLHGTGGWPLEMYKIDGEDNPFRFMSAAAYLLPGEHAFRYVSEEVCGDAGFVTFKVDLKPGYSYFVTANVTDSDTDTACIFEELRNDPAARTSRLAPRKPQAATKALQCDSLQWKEWK
jgi:hypothetical protein